MNRGTLVTLLALFSASCDGFSLEPPENQWLVEGDTFSLRCSSSLPLESCSWTTPYEKKYPLSKGLTAESGRLEYFGDNEKDCGIRVAAFEKRDSGKWACLVSVVNGSEVTTGEGYALVSIAQEPTSVTIAGHLVGDGAVNVSMLSSSYPVDCRVDSAKPKPVISWFVDDDELTGFHRNESESNDVYTQTLQYQPAPDHANKSLRCVVEHKTLDEPMEDSVELIFVDDVVVGESRTDTKSDDVDSKEQSYYIIGVVGVVVVLSSFFILFASSKKILCFKYLKSSAEVPDAKGDAEMKSLNGGEEKPVHDESEPLAASETKKQKFTERFFTAFGTKHVKENDIETGKGDAEATADQKTAEDAPSKERFGDRFASFFRLNKTKSETAADVESPETNEEVDKNESVVTNGVEKHETDAVQTEKPTTGGLMSCLAGLCHGSDGDKAPSDASDEETKDHQDRTDEKEKQIEFEPEDKDTETPDSNGKIETSSAVQTPV